MKYHKHRYSFNKVGGKPFHRPIDMSAYTFKAWKGGLRYVFRRRNVLPSAGPPVSKFGDFSLAYGEGLKVNFKRVSPVFAEGNRLMNIELLRKHMMDVTLHILQCEKAHKLKDGDPLKLFYDERNLGLASVMYAQCVGCKRMFEFTSSPVLNNKMFDINVRGVWASMVTGDGGSQLSETMATLNAPGLTQTTFTKIEHQIGKWWLEELEEDMLAAGVMERNLAIERGDFYQGVPAISVICDGGWSKRAHKHSYNALGGVAIIIGAATGRILHVGVRNKYCYICTAAKTKGIPPKEHECFKNWTESSQKMESDIIVEGFLQAEQKHGVRYMRLIADGDSSVEARIRENVPIWGKHISKIECANHACKCLRSSLEKLVLEKPSYKGRNKLTKVMRLRITSFVRCAIGKRSKEENKAIAVSKLKHDILNTINHVFGIHDNCVEDICKVAMANHATDKEKDRCALAFGAEECASSTGSKDENPRLDVQSDENGRDHPSDSDTVFSVLDEQVAFCTEGSSVSAQEESRGETPIPVVSIDTEVRKDVSRLLARLVDKAENLISCQTTNLAECWMSIRAKFDGGKFYNRIYRGSWNARCYGGGLRQNFGPQWAPKVWEKVTGTKAGEWFDVHYERRSKKVLINRKYRNRPGYKAKVYQRKLKASAESSKSKACLEYGKDALECVPDISADVLQANVQEYLGKHIALDEATLTAIETKTKSQSQCGLWHEERRKRLTSSVFGEIIRRNPGLKVEPLVRRLLYTSFRGNRFTRLGLQEESSTKLDYIHERSCNGMKVTNIEEMGLVVSREYPYLAASTDGKVTIKGKNNEIEYGLIEIKNVLHNKQFSLKEATQKVNNFCLENKHGIFSLKKSHSYYYQVQGQLNILDAPWCDFVIRRTNPFDMLVIRIFKDRKFWKEEMVPKLEAFYFKAVLPELASQRFGKWPGIREPGIWFSRPKRKAVKRKKND